MAVAVLVRLAASAQLRITSFDSSGELSWTNSIYRGLYGVEAASTPVGPWNLLGTVGCVVELGQLTMPTIIVRLGPG